MWVILMSTEMEIAVDAIALPTLEREAGIYPQHLEGERRLGPVYSKRVLSQHRV